MPIDQFEPYLCSLCIAELPQHKRALCPHCGKAKSKFNQHCLGCMQVKPCWYALEVGMPYTLEVKYLIQQLKFANQPQVGVLLGQIFSTYLINKVNKIVMPDCLISMPLHRKRLRERGYNQAQLIAQELAIRLNIPLLPADDFIRTRYTQPQSQQDKATRKTNVQGAFRATRVLNYKHVALIDDVLTTGQTAEEASLALLNNGIKRVDVWCIARA